MKWCEVVPVEECSFLVVEKPTKLRLSAEQVELNFSARSPWPAGRLLYRQDSAALYLWFIKGLAEAGRKVQIPEGYLLVKPFLDSSAAILVYRKESAGVYTVIKKGRLATQVVFSRAMDTDEGLEERLSLLTREFSLEQPEVIHITEDEVPEPTWRDLWEFIGLKADRALLDKALEWGKNVAITVLAISALYGLFNHSYLQHLIKSKENQLQQMQQQNIAYRQRLLNIAGESKIWSVFATEESGPTPWLGLMDALAESLQKQNSYLKSARFSGGELIVQAGLKGTAPELVKQLLATDLFTESKIISTQADPENPGTDLVNIRLGLQPPREATDD